ncbi:MAG: hypothetical protein J6L88_00295 [Clostridia bacterium]|nr:hypothetical protein [Clostridia bacterium]
MNPKNDTDLSPAQQTYPIGAEQVRQAEQILKNYKQGKAVLEHRIVDNELWYRMRHSATTHSASEPASASGWLFNAIANKHADAMDNYPEPVILPREQTDAAQAKLLSAVLPAILERCDFEDIYSDAWWYKLKHGAACYGVFWSDEDICIRSVDLLNLFWEPGVEDIQQSRNVFHVQLVDRDLLAHRWSVLRDALAQPSIEITRYLYDDAVDTSNKAAVVDWYYKKDGVLHYCKFCQGQVLYASENDELLQNTGYYDHGLYPFVIDALYPVSGSPAGFGLVDVMRDAQVYIDRLNSAMLKNALMASKKRFFIRADGSVNEQEFADFSRDFVHVMSANLGQDSIREIETKPLDDIYVSLLNNKITEIKEVTGNRDFSQGGTTGGVTAASAIAALQEAGSKLSRDMVKGGYRAFCKICNLMIELIRQFYDEPRMFRITGAGASEAFVMFDNRSMQPMEQGDAPVFDVRISAARANPFSRISQNELACEFFRLGLFQSHRAAEALCCLSMMDFEGRDEMIRRIRENAMRQTVSPSPVLPKNAPRHDVVTQAKMQSAQAGRV